jgi:DNA-binding Xre family transcriptional regulator
MAGVRLRVKEVALQKGLTMGLLSRKANIDLRTIRRIYRHPESVVTTETLGRLAAILEVDVSLLIESDPPGPRTLE